MNSSKPIHESLGAGVIKKDLGEIKSIWSHINWTLIPPAALHRIGAAESMVKATKGSLCYPPTGLPSILEFNVVFKSIATTINNRTVHYTSGRFGRTSHQSLYGTSVLPVLHNSMSLALPIMREVHQGYVGVNHCKSPPNMSGGSE